MTMDHSSSKRPGQSTPTQPEDSSVAVKSDTSKYEEFPLAEGNPRDTSCTYRLYLANGFAVLQMFATHDPDDSFDMLAHMQIRELYSAMKDLRLQSMVRVALNGCSVSENYIEFKTKPGGILSFALTEDEARRNSSNRDMFGELITTPAEIVEKLERFLN